MIGKVNDPEVQFQIILSHSWKDHIGMEERQSLAQIEAQETQARETAALLKLLDAFQEAANPVAARCTRQASSFQPPERFRPHHFDLGIDITHVVEVVAACASAVPLTLVIRSARDVLMAWFKRRSHGVKVKLGGGREIEVRSVAELDAVPTRLETSDFAKGPAKAATKEAPLSQANSHDRRAAAEDKRRPTRPVSEVVDQRPPYPPAMSTTVPIRVNRAPVLTLWAAVVAERLGFPPDTALTLGRFVAGSSARAKARRLGIADEAQEAAEPRERAAALKPQHQVVRLLGRDVPVLPANDGTLHADDNGKPASARGVRSYVMRAFGDRMGEARAAMEALAASLPPDELNLVGFRLYERFRPEVPVGAEGRGAKGELRIERIQSARA